MTLFVVTFEVHLKGKFLLLISAVNDIETPVADESVSLKPIESTNALGYQPFP